MLLLRGRLTLTVQSTRILWQYYHGHTSRYFHTSPVRKAAWFAFLMTPFARGAMAVAARFARFSWKRMSPERRTELKKSLSKRKNYLYGLLGISTLHGVGYYYSHIQETPITGRKRFINFSRKELVELIEPEKATVIKSVASDCPILPKEDPRYDPVVLIVKQIIGKNWSDDFDGINWHVLIVDNPKQVNAVCLPSGEIIVYTGLLEYCHNQNELAFILAHEMAHVILGHGAEGLSHRGVVEFFMMFVVAGLWAIVPSDLAAFFLHKWSRTTADLLLNNPYSRHLEEEADSVGLMLATRACFEPQKAIDIWKRFPYPKIKGVDHSVVEYLSTHPSSENRYDMLTALLPSANRIWIESECKVFEEEAQEFQTSFTSILKKTFKFW